MKPSDIKYIVIHCSASPPKNNVDIATITQWHKARGFDTVGYHYVITRDGTQQKGRPDDVPGAHAEGHNKESLGICLVGGVSNRDVTVAEDNFTSSQYFVLRRLLGELKQQYPLAKVLGHRDLPGVKKACPSFDVATWYRQDRLQNGG